MRVFDIGGQDGVENAVSNAIWTVPNVLSFIRLLALPIVYLDLVNGHHLRAAILLGIFSATDWLDGYVARRFDQVTKLGQLLDPFSDRLLVVVVGIGMVQADLIPLWALLVVVVRDVAVLGGGILMVARKIQPPPVTKIGKLATFGLMFALPTFILASVLGDGASAPHGLTRTLAWVQFISATTLYWIAAGQYAVAVMRGTPAEVPTTLAGADAQR